MATWVKKEEEPKDETLKVAMIKMENDATKQAIKPKDDELKGQAKGKESCKEEKCKNIPSSMWYGDIKRDKYFSKIYSKLYNFQQQLPMIKEIENDPKNARYYDKPLSLEVERILNHSLLKKLGGPGEFCIMVTLANGEKVKALIDLGAACNIIPSSMCFKIGNFDIKLAQ